MSDNFLPFAMPDISDEEIAGVVECLKSGWLTTGKKAKEFENEFAQYIGGGVEAVAVNSATMGLQLVLEALDIGEGDEVIVPTYTFSASAMVVIHCGAKPVLVDICADTLNIAVDAIEAAITPRTKAIIVVHFAGLSVDMDAITAVAKKYNLKVIEDAAHALPATYKGTMLGANTSDATVYSFYVTKTITTGEGGMIVSANKQITERCKIMRLHGISRDAFDRYTAKGASWRYEIVGAGHKCNLTDLAATIGLSQLKKAKLFLDRRTHIAEKYLSAFADLPLILPATAPEGDIHSWHLFVIRLKPSVKISRDAFIDKMVEMGIGCSVHFIPLHFHPFYKQTYGFRDNDFPVAAEAFSTAVSLPIYTKMQESDVDKVINAVREILC